ncbi:hypothetical protein T484DRAFT_1833303, partial [Baffinella frigidus]
EGLMCVMCMSEIPCLRCDVCRQDLCAGCDAALHAGRAMQDHRRKGIDPPPLPPPSNTSAKKKSVKSKGMQLTIDAICCQYYCSLSPQDSITTFFFGMQQKIDAICHYCSLSPEDSKALLKRCEWDVERAREEGAAGGSDNNSNDNSDNGSS